MKSSDATTLLISGIAALGLLQGASATTQPKVTQPTNNQIIRVYSYPYNLLVKGYAVTSVEMRLYAGGDTLIDTATAGPGNFTAALTVEGPGPHQLVWSGKSSDGTNVTATINFTVETLTSPPTLKDAIGVNINACVGWDPVLGKSEAAAPAAPNMQFVQTWVDRLERDGIKYIRLTVAWESMFPLATKQANVLAQINNWADYCRQKQIFLYPTFMTFPHHGLPSTSAASSTNMYARGFPKYFVQSFLPSSTTNDPAFFTALYSNNIPNVANAWDDIWQRFWKPILEQIDSNEYVLGYELCNEPPAYNITMPNGQTQVQGLGDFHTDIAQKMRSWGSEKWIMFVQGFPQGGGGFWNNIYNRDIAPRVGHICYCPHNYAGTSPTGWQQRFTDRMNSFKTTADALQCPVIVDEFGIGLVGAPESILTQANMDHIFSELKRLEFGGMCWVYWPGSDPIHRMITSTGALTANYGQLYINSRLKEYGY